jgi:hypothetical protein
MLVEGMLALYKQAAAAASTNTKQPINRAGEHVYRSVRKRNFAFCPGPTILYFSIKPIGLIQSCLLSWLRPDSCLLISNTIDIHTNRSAT